MYGWLCLLELSYKLMLRMDKLLIGNCVYSLACLFAVFQSAMALG
jgi:hypothetical protein